MEKYFRSETSESIDFLSKELIKIFANTKNHLPVDIDVEKRYAIFFEEGAKYAEQLRNFEVRKDDVWVITMPKSGTTWMLELVWMLVNNCDYETAKKTDQRERCIYLEYCAGFALNPSCNSIEDANNMKSPRVLKSHLPILMLPKGLWTVKPKIVYVARDPKDAIVSFYHFSNGIGLSYPSGLEVWVNEAVNDRNIYGPYWSHVAEFWKLRNEPNIYFTSFERMKKDLKTEILKVSKLLEKSISTEQLDKLAEHLTFDKMKTNESCNNKKFVELYQNKNGIEKNPMGVFIRKGKVGSYKEDLNNDLIKTLDDWTKRSTEMHGINPQEILFS